MPPPSPSTTSSGNSSSSGGAEQLSKTNLYIRGLHPGTSDQDLVKLCQPYGKIVSTKAILDKTTNKCKGKCVLSEGPGGGGPSCRLLTDHMLSFRLRLCGLRQPRCRAEGRQRPQGQRCAGTDGQGETLESGGGLEGSGPWRLTGCPLHPQQQEQDPTNLYISNLPVSMDEQELEGMLKPFGQVISTRILRDANGTSRGVGFARMESTEKCDAIIQHFNGKYIKTPPGVPVPSEPLLCKFADGGQKKRQNPSRYLQNGRPWPRDGETAGMTLTYDPTPALQNGFYSAYGIAPNRMITQTSMPPYLHSPVSSYQYLPATTAMQGAYIPQYTAVPSSSVPVEVRTRIHERAEGAACPPQCSRFLIMCLQDSSGQQPPTQASVAIETASEHGAYSYQHGK
ncbi:RBMS1 protein, partial [Polypterus senegalus]